MRKSAIYQRILENNVEELKLILPSENYSCLTRDCSVLRDSYGNSPLHFAVQNQCSVSVFSYLLEHISLALRNNQGLQVQDLIKRNNQPQYYSALKRFLADKIRDGDGVHFKIWLLHGWDFENIVNEVIDDLFDYVNDDLEGLFNTLCRVSQKLQELHRNAILGEKAEVWRIIGESVSDEDAEELLAAWDTSGLTILHKLVICEQSSLLKELVDRFPNISNCVDYIGRTALHLAAAMENSCCNLYDELVNHGASEFVRDLKDLTPQDYRSKKLMVDMHSLRQAVLKSIANFPKEEIKEVNHPTVRKQSKSILPSTFTSEESIYLQNVLCKPLIDALTNVVEKRPADPIECLATYLVRHNDLANLKATEMQMQRPSSNRTVESLSAEKESHSEECSFSVNSKWISVYAIQERDQMGRTKVHEHVLRGGTEFLQLIAEGNNFALRDQNGKTPRDLALEMENNEALSQLDSIVTTAVDEDNVEVIEALICLSYAEYFPNFFDFYGPDLFGVPAAMAELLNRLPRYLKEIEEIFAATLNTEITDEQLEHLITNETKACAFNNRGLSVIHMAIEAGNTAMVQFLVKNYPKTLRLCDYLNRISLHYGEKFGSPMIELLKQYASEIPSETLDALGHAPEYYAESKNEFIVHFSLSNEKDKL